MSKDETHRGERELPAWLRGVDSEINFWDYWFASKGGEWPQDYAVRLDPEREFSEYLLGDFPEPEKTRILDVGAGPVTGFGFRHRGRKLDVTACDPLAQYYDRILERHGVEPPVRTVTAFAEELSAFFAPASFDLVVCSNALDHSIDPERGIEEMLIVVRMGGKIHLTHRLNEAEFGKYTGLHQWNFDGSTGTFINWNKDNRIDVQDRFRDYADFALNHDPALGYVTLVLRKRAEFPAGPERYRERLRRLLPATMQAVQSLVEAGHVEPSRFIA